MGSPALQAGRGAWSFYEQLTGLDRERLADAVSSTSEADVERVLSARVVDQAGFLALLSEAAVPFLEDMACRAHALTVQHFGKVILLYTPLYLANFCANRCVYCGFAAGNRIERRRLRLEEIECEARAIAQAGLSHVLILTGDSRSESSVDYIAAAVRVLRPYFDSISIEIYALDADEYERLVVSEGVDGLTIYQETYDPKVYAEVHPAGPKRDFRYRLEAPDRACQAGIRTVNVGALLGLADWRLDALATGLHVDYLQRRYPEVEVSLSLPRIRPHEGAFVPTQEVTDREFVQILLASRLFLPRAGITVSTRETKTFRDNLVPLGVTKMSAGSCTAVGGRTNERAQTGQFDICDERGVAEVREALAGCGYKAILKDWHPLGGAAGAPVDRPATSPDTRDYSATAQEGR